MLWNNNSHHLRNVTIKYLNAYPIHCYVKKSIYTKLKLLFFNFSNLEKLKWSWFGYICIQSNTLVPSLKYRLNIKVVLVRSLCLIILFFIEKLALRLKFCCKLNFTEQRYNITRDDSYFCFLNPRLPAKSPVIGAYLKHYHAQPCMKFCFLRKQQRIEIHRTPNSLII